MAQQTDENDKPLTYWGGLDFTNKNANNIKSDSTQLSGTILASESLGVDNLVNKQQTAELQYKKDFELNSQSEDLLNEKGELEYILVIKTRANFLWRLWFLISAPIIWLFKGTIKIK